MHAVVEWNVTQTEKGSDVMRISHTLNVAFLMGGTRIEPATHIGRRKLHRAVWSSFVWVVKAASTSTWREFGVRVSSSRQVNSRGTTSGVEVGPPSSKWEKHRDENREGDDVSLSAGHCECNQIRSGIVG